MMPCFIKNEPPTDWDDQVYVRTMVSRLVQIGRNAQHGSTPDVDDLRVLDDAEKLLGRGA